MSRMRINIKSGRKYPCKFDNMHTHLTFERPRSFWIPDTRYLLLVAGFWLMDDSRSEVHPVNPMGLSCLTGAKIPFKQG
jgi:hypothetical protein